MKAFCLLNHQLTEKQVQELKNDYNCSEIAYPSEIVSSAWSQISATKELDCQTISKVVEWLSSAECEDVFIIQGEYGSCW